MNAKPLCVSPGHPSVLAACISRADDKTQQEFYADLGREGKHDTIRWLVSESEKRARTALRRLM